MRCIEYLQPGFTRTDVEGALWKDLPARDSALIGEVAATLFCVSLR